MEYEELEKNFTNKARDYETLETKRQGLERNFEMSKKQLNEKIQNLNDIIEGEKQTRDMWIGRYEKEQ